MNNSGNRTPQSTDLNPAVHLSKISAVCSQTVEKPGRAVNVAANLLRNLLACGASAFALTRPSSSWAASGALPWDQPLTALQQILIGPVAHAAIALAFVGAGFLYAVGGYEKQAACLAASGIGGCLALSAIRLLNFVLP